MPNLRHDASYFTNDDTIHMAELTKLLTEYRNSGEPPEELVMLVFKELRQIARRKMQSEKPGHTLQATALVNETYLRLFGEDVGDWQNRRHFFAAATKVMQNILVDKARRKSAIRRGGEFEKVEIELNEVAASESRSIEEISEALDALSAADSEAAELVRLRYFAGMTIREAADTMEISSRTASRVWKYARAFLLKEMEE